MECVVQDIEQLVGLNTAACDFHNEARGDRLAA